MELTNSQRKAIDLAKEWWNSQDLRDGKKQVFYINGAAGTGKSTTVMTLINEIKLNMDQVAFATFAGKASLVLIKKGIPAQTIHRLIYHPVSYLDKKTGLMKIYFKLKTPEELAIYSLFVIDECSMVGKNLWQDLLSFQIPVIILGDTNQLPPVRDKEFEFDEPDVTLTEIVRTAEDDPIVLFSRMILNGDEIPCDGTTIGDSVLITNSRRLPDRIIRDSDVILCWRNKTRSKINEYYRSNFLNIHAESLYLNEKIICRKNDWSQSCSGYPLVNGTIGYAVGIEYSEHSKLDSFLHLDFMPDYFEDLRISSNFENLLVNRNNFTYGFRANDLENKGKSYDRSETKENIEVFEFAYAITTHLAQGSEWPNVLCFYEFMKDSELRTRWLYTSITRASERFILARM